ncbi:diguanylate cyclase (GGDEF)-like protein [Halospina denitrificans]|uniref:diguanylate cyclase n=1 Tax=Halospina denitrificans TaxID=332522 RepID=A0A4R7JKU3_9GAMM|nr:GGDEF domain-containing protein [Halospina denitrificans]TDT37707.1 diguanylate cyclase (GGDEF)-like protein [Halospina denitrificans]
MARSRVARMIYGPRIVFMALSGLILLPPASLAELPGAFWVVWVLAFWVWPHLAFWRSRVVADPTKSEYQHIHADAAMVGAGVAYVGFPLPVLFLFLAGTGMTHVSLRGVRGFFEALFYMVLGAGVGGWFNGYAVQLQSGLLTQALAFVALLVGVTMISATAYTMNRRQRRTKHQVEDKNRILEALHDMSILALRTEDVDDLLGQALDSMVALMPHYSFAIALSEPGRPGTLHHLQYRGFDAARVNHLTEALRRIESARLSRDKPLPLELPDADSVVVVTMGAHLTQLTGLLIISSSEPLTEEAWQKLELFEDQIASLIENRLLTARLTQMAETDPLTGVYNRACFHDVLSSAGEKRRGPAGMEYALVSVDVNGLKEINDHYGHEAGDRVILKAVELLREVTRTGDSLIRLGGDEFVVLCLDCDSSQAERVVERIRQAERGTVVAVSDAHGREEAIPVRLSLGYAASDRDSEEDMMRMADQRMYADKETYYETRQRYR